MKYVLIVSGQQMKHLELCQWTEQFAHSIYFSKSLYRVTMKKQFS